MRFTTRLPGNPGPVRRSNLGLLSIGLVSLVGLMACGLLSRAPSVLPNTGNLVTQEAGKLVSTVVAAGQETPVATTSSPQNKAASVSPKQKLPLSFTYANLKFSLEKAVITSEAPTNSSDNGIGPWYAVTTWKINNPTKSSIGVNGGLTLKLKDGSTAQKGFDISVNQLDTMEQEAVISVPSGSNWDASQIAFAEEGKEPAVLAIDGAAPVVNFPVTLTPPTDVTLKTANVVYHVKSASVDLDALGQRVSAGKEFVLLTVDATCKSQSPCYVGPESFRVIVDDNPIGPLKVDPSALAVDPDTTQTINLAFEIPQHPKKVVLQEGEADKDTQQVPLDLSSVK